MPVFQQCRKRQSSDRNQHKTNGGFENGKTPTLITVVDLLKTLDDLKALFTR